jgi:hypothetical protein
MTSDLDFATETPKPKPWDSAALLISILLGIAVAVFVVVRATIRIVEIAGNRDVAITAAFADTPATLPIGPDGAAIDVIAQEVVFRVSDLPPVSLVSLILAEAVFAVAAVITIASVCIVLRNLIRGRAFVAQTGKYVGIASLAAVVGWVLTWLFTTMGANGGSSALSGTGAVNTAFPVDPLTIFAIAAIGALSVAFQAGYRLQRDTDGLV